MVATLAGNLYQPAIDPFLLTDARDRKKIYNSLLNLKVHLPVKDPLRYFRCNHE
jgi:hypothetical protein